VVSNGLMWATSQTDFSVEALPNSGGTGPNGEITIDATNASANGLLRTTSRVNGVPISYIYQPLPSIGASGGGAVVYNFTITNAGSYEIQALVNAPNVNANSFYVNIDGQPRNPTMIWDIMPVTSGFEQRTVCWRGNGTENNDQIVPKVFNLSAGSHQIIFAGREPYTALSSFTLIPVASVNAGASQPGTTVNSINDSIRTTVDPTAAATLTGAVQPGGKFSLSVNGIPGHLYEVQASTNMIDWMPLHTNTAPFLFVDPDAGKFQQRFYRTLYLQ
jgi:hypothetical protein